MRIFIKMHRVYDHFLGLESKGNGKDSEGRENKYLLCKQVAAALSGGFKSNRAGVSGRLS